MKHNKSRRQTRSFCPTCSIRFQRRRIKCPYCRTVIIGSLPLIILSVLGVAAVLLTITFLNVNYF